MSPEAASAQESRNNTLPEHLGRSLLKRAIVGVLLLSVLVSSGAWLLHAGIEAEAVTAGNEVAVSEPAGQTR